MGYQDGVPLALETRVFLANACGGIIQEEGPDQVEQLAITLDSYGLRGHLHLPAFEQTCVALSFQRGFTPKQVSPIAQLLAERVRERNSSSGDYTALPRLISKYNQVLKEIFNRCNENLKRGDLLKGNEKGIVYYAWRPNTGRSGSFVAHIDLQIEGKWFECVIKERDDKTIKRMVACVGEPISKYFSRNYGTVGRFQVMERLQGLEEKALINYLDDDPHLLKNYADSVWNLIQKIAHEGFALADVFFGFGTNCFWNPNTGSISLIERECLIPSNARFQEIITKQLFTELWHAPCAFYLLRAAFRTYQPNEFHALDDLRIVEEIPLPSFLRVRVGFSQRLIDTVLNDDLEAFKRVIKEQSDPNASEVARVFIPNP